MAKHPIHLRPAEPDENDGLHFARFLDQAAEGFFRFWLGRRAEAIIASAFPEPQHSLSYQHVTFAVRDGELVGMTSAYTGKQLRGFSELPLVSAAGRFPLRMMCTSFLLAPIFRVLNSVADEDFYLQGIAVEPSLRGEGIGSMLLDAIEHRASDSGAQNLCLDVAAKNTGARRLYARLAMNEVSVWPDSRIVRPLFVRMSKRC